MSHPPSQKSQEYAAHFYPPEFARAEAAMIGRRRRLAGVAPEAPRAGIALSGGGIRSATFCLGMLQALAGAKVLRQLDYASTASGGGFIGSFLGAWISRRGLDEVEAGLPRSDGEQVGFLRENGRYIAPNGSGDLWAAFATALRSWICVLFVLGVFTFAFFVLAAAAREALWNLGVTHPTSLAGWPAVPVQGDWFWPSVWLIIAKYVVLVLVVPLLIAFWLLGQRPHVLAPAAWTVPAAGAAAAAVFWCVKTRHSLPDIPLPRGGAALLLGIAVTFTLAALAFSFFRASLGNDLAPARRGLTDMLAAALGATAALAGFGVVDSLAASLLHWQTARSGWQVAEGHALAAAAIAAAKFIWPLVSKSQKTRKRASLPVSALAGAAAVLLAVLLLSLLDFWALSFAQSVGAWSALGDGSGHPKAFLVAAAALLLVLSLLTGRPLGLVNLSSEHKIYSARLTRAYLGASNPNRFNGADFPNGQNITDPIKGDDVRMNEYLPHEKGGPLHVINVTVNETISGMSQIEQRDRKGMGMALGPAGMSLGRVHHAMFADPMSKAHGNTHGFHAHALHPEPVHAAFQEKMRVFPLKPPDGAVAVMGYRDPSEPRPMGFMHAAAPAGASQSRAMEQLPLGDWLGVSGAAFSTGMGSQTSLGLSFLAGIFNVRLGYWWDSGVKPHEDPKRTPPSVLGVAGKVATAMFPAQLLLIDELLARFHGTGLRYWYLSDGGHFENTAAYELIRRKVPVIIICDCGADPGYAFDDIGNLVRKARLDFNAEITFVDPEPFREALNLPKVVGTLAELRQTIKSPTLGKISTRHAALARVRYDGNPAQDSVLLLVKPTLTGDEPTDVMNYRSSHRAFPQEPTADQFFDEAQWESYRRLGQLIGLDLFPERRTQRAPWLWSLPGKI
jgi:hypothetical protein